MSRCTLRNKWKWAKFANDLRSTFCGKKVTAIRSLSVHELLFLTLSNFLSHSGCSKTHENNGIHDELGNPVCHCRDGAWSCYGKKGYGHISMTIGHRLIRLRLNSPWFISQYRVVCKKPPWNTLKRITFFLYFIVRNLVFGFSCVFSLLHVITPYLLHIFSRDFANGSRIS